MKVLFSVVVLAMITSACGNDPSLTVASTTSIEEGILVLVNQHRGSKSLAPLNINETMSAEARSHSQNMANGTSTFSHDGFDERIQRIHDAIGGNSSGENIAKGQKTAQAVMDSWLSSPGHKANIEGNFDLLGIGVAREENGPLYFTQIFLRE